MLSTTSLSLLFCLPFVMQFQINSPFGK
jgi:hypothetical protein